MIIFSIKKVYFSKKNRRLRRTKPYSQIHFISIECKITLRNNTNPVCVVMTPNTSCLTYTTQGLGKSSQFACVKLALRFGPDLVHSLFSIWRQEINSDLYRGSRKLWSCSAFGLPSYLYTNPSETHNSVLFLCMTSPNVLGSRTWNKYKFSN